MASRALSSQHPMLNCQRQCTSYVTRGQPVFLVSRPRHGSYKIRNVKRATAAVVEVKTEEVKKPASHGGWRSLQTSLGDPAYRAKLAEEYGFTNIGEPLPESVTMKDIVKAIPPEAFKLQNWKAWRCAALSVGLYFTGLCWSAVAPWHLLPLSCACSWTGLAGMFVLAHDCGHRNFNSNRRINDIVGTLLLLPLLYPFESWRLKHDLHHTKTNMLNGDTAWHPLYREHHDKAGSYERMEHQLIVGPLRFCGTIYHWLDRHFNPESFRPNERDRVKRSIGIMVALAVPAWALIFSLAGFSGWVKLWLVPFLGAHHGMSLMTTIQHTAPHIHFKDAKTWHKPEAQLLGSINVDFTKVGAFLFHDVMLHIPHHVAPNIPCYNLPLANEGLRKKWGKHFNETYLNFRFLKTLLTRCHVYDEQEGYVPLDYGREELPFIGAIRRWMPNYFWMPTNAFA